MNVPGRTALDSWVRSVRPHRADLRPDVVAGLPGAIASVPDGMASAVLTGVSPVHGLYACFAGPIGGGLTASTRLMVITTTTAAALAAGSAIENVDPDERAQALFLLTLIAGIVMIAAGLLRLGRLTRFVSHSVMIGFLTGVAVNIVLGQISDLTGAATDGDVSLTKALSVLTNPSRIDIPSLLIGLGALALLVVLGRTRFAVVSSLIALVIPTAVMLVAGLDSIARVDDIGAIPRGIPTPAFPDLGLLSFGLITGAFAVAAIVLVQGAGVAEAAPNADGSMSDPNQDFIAQGVGNVTSGLFRGQPVGGSVGQTALNRSVGARSRWAGIWAGIWMLIILLLFSGVVGKVALPTLAAILIYAGIGSIRPGQIATIMRAGPSSQIAVITTFVATLFLPVTAAVGIGVVISLLLQLNQEAMDLKVVELVETSPGRFDEQPAPTHLTSNRTVVIDVYGSLFYAGSKTLQARLPDPVATIRPAVVLRLRGRTTLGATFFKIIGDYAAKLDTVEGRLFISGADDDLVRRAHEIGHVNASPVQVFGASQTLGDSTHAALTQANAYIVRRAEASEPC